MKQAAKGAVHTPQLQFINVQGEQVRITGQPDVDRVTVAIGEACEITLPSEEAMQFACLLFRVAGSVYVARPKPAVTEQAAGPVEVVM